MVPPPHGTACNRYLSLHLELAESSPHAPGILDSRDPLVPKLANLEDQLLGDAELASMLSRTRVAETFEPLRCALVFG